MPGVHFTGQRPVKVFKAEERPRQLIHVGVVKTVVLFYQVPHLAGSAILDAAVHKSVNSHPALIAQLFGQCRVRRGEGAVLNEAFQYSQFVVHRVSFPACFGTMLSLRVQM